LEPVTSQARMPAESRRLQ